MTKKKETMKYAGKEVPMTKAGLPSLVHLPKEAREVVKKYKEQKKKEKQEILTKELIDLLNKLG